MTRQLPHFEHHRREILANRRRFSGVLLVLCMAITVIAGIELTRPSQAAVLVTGRVYNMDTGQGLPNVQIRLCLEHPNVYTNASGVFAYDMEYGKWYCVVYLSGAPANMTLKDAPNNRPGVGVQNLYDYQISGRDCYQNYADSHCANYALTWDLAVDSGLDLRFVTNPTPAPTPKPTPKPSVAPKPATPKPIPTPVVVPPPLNVITPVPTIAASPIDFQALANADNAYISLLWSVPAGATDLRYTIERSTDKTRWDVIKSDLTEPRYQDDSAAYGTHYYYRVRSATAQGDVSGYVLADAKTPDFISNTSESESSIFTSDDQLASLLVPAGAIVGSANCSIARDDQKIDGSGRVVVLGLYRMLCKNSSGTIITDVLHPVVWTLRTKDAIKNYSDPVMVSVKTGGEVTELTDAHYDKSSGIMEASVAGATSVAVLAKPASNPISLGVAVAGVLILIGGGIGFVLLLRRGQRLNYDEYLRTKYYNL